MTVFPASINLSNLNGVNGFSITGFTVGGSSASVSSAGDVNDDGIDDLIVGATYGDSAPSAYTYVGVVYVLFGRSGIGSSGSISVSSLTGSTGFAITGFPANSLGGWSVSGAGDVNADGIADLIVGAPHAAPCASDHICAGASYVLFGKSGIGSFGSIDVSSLTGPNGFAITGFPEYAEGGFSVSGAGDVNDDGIADLIVGGPYYGLGVCYVLFGKSGIGNSGSVSVSSLDGSNGFTIIFSGPGGGNSGYSVSNAGDVNGDGITDLIVGAPYAFGTGAGYVIFGQSGIGSSGSISISNLNGSNGFAITGFAGGSEGGFSVSGAGDVNDDGIADLIIGAPYANAQTGISYVLFGQSGIGGSGSISVSNLNGSNGFAITGFSGIALAGFSVSGAGDVNSDGIADLIVAATYAGVRCVLFGQSGVGSSGSISVSSLTGSNGFLVIGSADYDSGGSVSSAGDVNDDGIDDLIIGATAIDYVIFGKPSLLTLTRNSLSIQEDQTLVLSSQILNATAHATKNALADLSLRFNLTGIKHGHFFASSNPSVALTSFTQQQVRKSQIQFAHDGSEWAPAYNVSVSYEAVTTAFQAAQINFQQSFVFVNNQLTINQGQTVILNSNNLSANDLYNIANNPNLIFSISSVQYGYFALTSAPVTPILRFTQAQIQSGKIQFVHDGSVNPPSFNVAVIDGVAMVSQSATISFDITPVIVTNTLTVNQGQIVVLTASNLSASDPYTSSFTFTISNVQYGYFALTSAPTTLITTFTQAQVQSGQVQFVHDGSTNPPSYSVSVSDGRMTTSMQAATISFDVPPALGTNTLIINQGQTVILSSTNLSASDPYTSSFTFVVSNVQYGYFALTSTPATPISSFTQTQIQASNVQFVHDGSLNPPSYDISVSDGRMTSAVQAGVISFDVPPTIVANALTVNQGQAVVLTTSDLSAFDPYTSSFTFTVSATHGYFALVSSPTSPILTFTQAQIQSGSVQFVPDGTTISPGYNVTVSDGRMSSSIQRGTVTFYLAPILTSNQLTINQGQSIILNVINLSATNPYGNSPGLTFIISNIQHGYFALTSAPTISVTSFTLGDIQRNSVQFVTDGSIYPPSFGVGVENAYMTTTPQAASISFDAIPVITSNVLTINQGQTVVLTTSDLNAMNPYNPTASLMFTVANVVHGNFVTVSNSTIPINTFSLSQIQSQAIQYVSDGSIYPPSYDVSVSDGRMTSAFQACVVSFDAMPHITLSAITLNQGQTIVLKTNYLNATNPYNPAAILTFIATDVQHGAFALITNPSQPLLSFTQQQVQSGDVIFGTDGSAIIPSYNISVTDGRLTTASLAATIVFNAAPMLTTNTLAIYPGQTQVLSSKQLSAVDTDDPADSLTFLINDIQAGQFEKISNPQQAITRFTQAEVQSAAIQFVADGSLNSPRYYVAVSDGKITTGAQSASVFFSAPTLIKNQIDIIQGQTIILSAKDLIAIDKGGNSSTWNLNFISSDVKRGYFAYVESPTFPITQFTQDQLQHGEIQFTHDGSSNAPSYWMAVSDGTFIATPRAGNVTFHPTPVITANRLSILEGATSILSTSDLSVSDPNPANLVFSVSQIAHGYFARVSNPIHSITNFTYSQLQAKEIAFIPDETGLAPTYQVSASDGYASCSPSSALITFSTPAPIVTSNTIRNSIIGSAASGTAGLLFLGFQLYLQNKTNRDLRRAIEKSDVDMIQPVAKKVFERINTLNILGYRSRKNAEAYIHAIGQMIKRVEELNGHPLKEMDIHQRSWFVNEMAKQIKKKVGKDPSCCSCAYLASFFKAEANPQEFQAKIEEVALAVHNAFPTTDSDKKIELRTA